jgi:hypothetical protein
MHSLFVSAAGSRLAARFNAVSIAWLLLLVVPTVLAAVEVPTIEKGFKPERAFQVGEIDNIRLLNGGLEIAIPLGIRYPVGGAGLSYGFTLHYSSQLWGSSPRMLIQ